MALHAMLHRTQTAAQRSMVQRGSQGKMVRCRVTGQKAACRLAVWMTVMKHTLRPWAQRRMLRRKLPLRAARWFWQKQRQQRMGCARKHRQQGRVLRQWGRRQLLRQARTVPHRLAAEMQADRANTAKANSTGKFPGKRRIPFRIFQRRRTSQRASLGQSGCALRTGF